MDTFLSMAAAVRAEAWRQQPSFTRSFQALRRFLLRQELVRAICALFPDEEPGTLRLVAPGELLTEKELRLDTHLLLARLGTLFPIHELFTDDLLGQGIPRVVPKPLGYQFSWDSLVDFCENPGTYYPEMAIPWLFWVSGEVDQRGEDAEEDVLASWELYLRAHSLAIPFPGRFLEAGLYFDWPDFAARLYEKGLLPFYTLTAALLNDTGNYFFDEDYLDQVPSFYICPESLAELQVEFREACALQEVIDQALDRLRDDPDILGEILLTLNLCWRPLP